MYHIKANTSHGLTLSFIYVNESDPRSNVHYLGSSENKAWKKKKDPIREAQLKLLFQFGPN